MRGIPLHAHEAAEALSLSLEAQASLAFAHEAGGAERYTFEAAASWCRDKWGGQTRQRWATAAAVNALNARSFRERGRRREGVKDLVNDLDLLFLQAGVVDDESRMRVLIGTFFEFPHAVARLSRSSSYGAAVTEALSWEADMIRKERDALAARVCAPHLVHLVPRPTTAPDDPSLDRPRHPTRPTCPPVRAHAPEPAWPHLDDEARRQGEATRLERGPPLDERDHATSLGRPRPSRSTETLNISLRSVECGTVRESSHDAPRAQSSLSRYSDGGHDALFRPSLPPRHRPEPPPSFNATSPGGGATLAVPPQRPSFSTARSVTPPFVTEATSFRSSFTSAGEGEGDGAGRVALYEAFPYPARASPGEARVRAALEERVQRAPAWGVGEALWRAASPTPGRSERHGLASQQRSGDERDEGRTLGQASRLAKLFKRSLHGRGHGRGRSIGSAAELSRLDEEGREAVQIGRPAKPRGKVVREGLQLPP
ncbi:uncharacterized protein RHOBADRAFT_41106 [Rhodotorula graminis WP1]|uniref:Uncharacterized protein n=1 Tax=Rhodotorula graminis (strain WP1) TaxID=578459 RepID=A0A194SG01_RHOGW|nr:uncharacterized protein RHOBADRAFT_41106 [Rhodotorula graminis WP1]KPV78561.1 hypothetical protein RHOBADRAFT_41106 [Rhodotorula graminis WP1]